jgi:hypothetical protein
MYYNFYLNWFQLRYLSCVTIPYEGGRDSAVCVAIGYELDGRGIRVRVPVGERFSLAHVVQTGFGTYPAFYPMGTVGSFPWSKAAGA